MRFSLLLLSIVGLSFASAETPAPSDPVSYWRDIAPVFKRNCVACHREGQAEGGLSLETAEALQAGGDSGELFDIKQSAASLLYVRVTDEDDIMPPDDNSVGAERLTTQELELLRRWIDQGAIVDEKEAEELGWQPIPESIRSSYTLAVSPDDSLAAIAHANRVTLSDTATGTVLQHLADENLPYAGVADYDFVQAISFSPDGDRLATGGFRTVRLWRQENRLDLIPREYAASARGPIAFHPDRSRVAFANAIGDLEVWSLADDVRQLSQSPNEGNVTAIAWPTQDQLLVGFEGGAVVSLSALDGQVAGRLDLGQPPIQLASHDATTVLARTIDGHLHWLHDFKLVEQPSVKAIEDARVILGVPHSSPSFAVATGGGNILLIDAKTAAVTRTIAHGAAVNSLAIHPTLPQLVSFGADGAGKLWNLADGKLLRSFEGEPLTNLRFARAQRDSARETSWLKQFESERDGIKKALEKEDAALKKVTEALDKATSALEEQAKKVVEATNTVTATEQKLTAAKSRMDSSKSDVESTTKLITAATANMQTLTAAVAPLEQEAISANAGLKTAEQKVAEAMRALQAAKTELTAVTTRVENAKKAVSDEKKRLEDLNTKLAAAKKSVSDTTAEIDRESKALDAQRMALDAATAEQAKRKTEVDKRQQAFVTATATRERAAANVPKHEAKIRRRASRVAATNQRLEDERMNRTGSPIHSATFTGDGNTLAVIASDRTLRTFDVTSGRATARFQLPGSMQQATEIYPLDASRFICLGSGVRPIELQLARTWSLERTIGGLDGRLIPDRVTALDFRPDGQALAIGTGVPSRSGKVLVASLNGTILREFDSLHSDTVLALKFSPDGDILASGSSDKTIRMVNVQSSEVVGALDGHTHHVMSLAWKRDGRVIASASADKTIKVWDAVTARQRRTIGGIPDELTAIQFLKDSSEVAVTCANGDVRIYNVDNGQMLRRAVAGEFLFTLGTTSDGARILTGGQSGEIKIWNSADIKLTGTWKE
ncbi:MAG: c-type cytochrome domain-containing protein [Planctomycetota bacterium]